MYNFFFKATRTLSRKKIIQKPPYNGAGCIVEPYNASRQPKFQFCQKKLVKVVTFMCARGPAPHVARGRKHCKRMASLYKHMGKLQRAVTLILRRESKFSHVKSRVLTHSACRCKNYLPKCSQFLQTFFAQEIFFFFFYLVFNFFFFN